jgi:aldehyde:ferredoxin oxidoreductase
MFGYHGRYLRIDLSRGEADWRPLDERILRRFLGGVGLGTWLLCREAPPGVEPLAPEAPLIFALGPLVGTPLTTSAKFAVLAKSPLTGRLNDSLSSSRFALAARRAGCDALAVVGECKRPSVLVIDDGRRPRSAWGSDWARSSTQSPSASPGRTASATPPSATRIATPAGAAWVRSSELSA